MATGYVSIKKQKVRAIDSTHPHYSVESDKEVFVIDTEDETLQLQTGTEDSGGSVDLTGSNNIGTAEQATTVIGANNAGNTTSISSPTITVGASGSSISIGTLGSADTIIGSSSTGNTIALYSPTVTVGTVNSSVLIGTASGADTTIGGDNSGNTTTISSPTITIGSTGSEGSTIRLGQAGTSTVMLGANVSNNSTIIYSPTVSMSSANNTVIVGGNNSRVEVGYYEGSDTFIGNPYNGNTTTIASQQTYIGQGSDCSTSIGAKESNNATNILASTITLGDAQGGRTINIGSPISEETDPNTIYIGGKTSVVQIGRTDSTSPSSELNIESRNITIGSNQVISGIDNQNSVIHMYGDSITADSKADISLECSTDMLVTAGDDFSVRAGDTTTLDSVYVSNSGTRTTYSLQMDNAQSEYTTRTYHSGNVYLSSRAVEINKTNGTEVSNKTAAILSLLGDYQSSSSPNATLKALNGIKLTGDAGSLGIDFNDQSGSYLDLDSSGATLSVKSYDGSILTESSHTSSTSLTRVNGYDGSKAEINITSSSTKAATYVNAGNNIGVSCTNSDSSSYLYALDEINQVAIGKILISSSATATSALVSSPEGTGTRGYLILENDSVRFGYRDSDNIGIAQGGYGVPNVDQAVGSRLYSSSGFYSGTSGGYAPFTGVHLFSVAENEDIQVGDAVVVLNKLAYKSSSANSKTCVGIAISVNSGIVEVAAVGDTECGLLRGFKVCNENGPIIAGDLLVTSSRPGYLMRQADDTIRSCTVGKVASDVVFDQDGLAKDIYGFVYCG
jgi:hypothetical protein